MRLILDEFGGIIPRAPAHKLPNKGATVAHDVKIRNGFIEPWRELCEFASVDIENRSFHVHGCCTLGWNNIVQSAETAPDWGRFYISGRRTHLEAVELDCNCNPSYFILGVPAPMQPPVVTGTEACGRDTDARSYVYTYVNKWGEESAPSPASDIVRITDGDTVHVTSIQLPDDGYGIIAANVYRATSGFREAKGKGQEKITTFLYVGTVKFPSTSLTDKVLMKNLGQPLETEHVRMPPAELENIVSIDNVVRFAATRKNRVYLSENFQPHNWPVKYELTLDSTIVHMVQNNGRLFVSTDTKPYVIDVTNCDDTKCTPVVDLDYPLPDISCGYQNSAIATPFGMFYSSPLGVVLISADGKWTLITKKWFSRNDWAKVAPETARFGFYEGFLFIVTDKVSFILDIDGEPYGDIKGTELVTISDKPVAMETTTTGQLMMLIDGKVWAWNSSEKYRSFVWESADLSLRKSQTVMGSITTQSSAVLGALWSPSSVKIRTQEVQFTLISPTSGDRYTRKVIWEKPFRLPRVGRHTHWRIRLEGNSPVEFVTLGTAENTVNDGA